MTRSIRFRSLLFVIGILVATTAAIALVTLREVDSTINGLEIQSARNAVNLVLLTLENDYRSLTFHRAYALEERKRQMSDSVGIVMASIAEHHDLAGRGLLAEEAARKEVLRAAERLRYGNNDYFFIYDLNITAIGHPDPMFRGKHLANLQDPKGNYPGRDLMRVARRGGGFTTFWWKRLESATPVQKLGYARFFEPWGWMVGTGVYIDDIEAEYRRRLDGVVADLAATLAKVKIAGNGYLFIFDADRRIIIHPEQERNGFATMRNAATGNLLVDDLMTAARSGTPLDYRWDRPDRPGEFRFDKTALAARFAPLDWYVVASVYRDELRKPARDLLVKQLLLISLISGLAVVGAAGAIGHFVRPVERLAAYARDLPARDFAGTSAEGTDIAALSSRPDELGRLAGSFRFMEQSLRDYLARLTEATAARERIESELGIAHNIQMGLLRKSSPSFTDGAGFDLHAFIRPAREVGGDFYDFFMIDDGRLFFIIADVAGKGIPASIYMAMTMALIKAIARSGASPDALLARLNDELSHDNEACMFVTVFCGILDPASGEIVFANGGHNPPLVARREGGVDFLTSPGKLPPGAMEGIRYGSETISLGPGDRLLLYTDGVTEAAAPDGALFSPARLQELVHKGMELSLHELTEEIIAAIEAFAGDQPQADDITIVTVEFQGGTGNDRPSP